MEKKLKSLRIQHLNATDKIAAALRDLHIDRSEFCVCDHILNREIEIDDESINATDIFLRACANMTKHLQILEKAFANTRRIYKEIMELLEADPAND